MPTERAENAETAIPIKKVYTAETFPKLQVVDGLLELFEDEQLTALTEQALANNPDVLAAAAQMAEAGFNLQKTRGALLPSLSGSGYAGRTRSSSTSLSNTFSAELDASWEVDLWGSLRSEKRAAEANYLASESAYEAARQSLAAQTMQAWFSLIAADKQLDLAMRERDSFNATYELVDRRYEQGIATSTEVALALTNAANAKADYQASENARNQSARALKVLLGEYPDDSLKAPTDWPNLEHTVPSGLPSDLLLARPDIIAAYQNIRASDALAKSAYADLFPSFTLTASGGRSSDTLSDLGRSAFDVWSLAGQLTAPIFEGGQLRAEVGAADARAEQSYQNYRSVVINAFAEVENALNSEAYLAREEAARLKALQAARSAEAKSLRDYESGLIEILDLLEAQRRVFTTEAQTISIRQQRLNNRVSLALALGSGI
jgi:NodT family efflux transporter outer membrane factor (OMF) lipoprotein